MKTENKIISLVICSILALAFSFGIHNLSAVPNSGNADSSGAIHYGSVVCVWKNGVLVSPCKHNLLTNVGLNMIQLALNGTASTATGVMLGNGTTIIAPTDTVLPGLISDSGLVNATGTYVYRGAGAWNVTKSFTSTGNSIGVNMTGLQDTTTKLLLAEANFTTTTLQANDVINVTWGIYITGTQ